MLINKSGKMRISQFQKYSQKENTVTNNVLLMLSRLNDLDTSYYRSIIERINEGSDRQHHNSQPIFTQQRGIKGGVIDGQIEVKSSKIVIETKKNSKESVSKLIKYGEAFKKNSENQLWHLSAVKFEDDEILAINKKLQAKYPDVKIQFNSLTFYDLIENLEGIYDENKYDKELNLLLEDFRNYCFESNLVSNEEYKLLFVPTGFSYSWNKKHKIYYCPISWHSQKFKFFGLYNWKSVRTISEIETVVIADYNAENDELIVHSKGHTVGQIERLKNSLTELGINHEGLKYYILPEDEFYETDFKKVSRGGIQGYRYKDLRDCIEIDDYNNTKKIAEELKKATWS